MCIRDRLIRVTRYIETETKSQKLNFVHTLMDFWLRNKLQDFSSQIQQSTAKRQTFRDVSPDIGYATVQEL